MSPDYPRDLIGYGRTPPHARWPGGARIALQFVLNYEEGGENCVLHGDPASEVFLSEIVGAAAYEARHLSMESIYEYGSRAGSWRLLREFEKRDARAAVKLMEDHLQHVVQNLQLDPRVADLGQVLRPQPELMTAPTPLHARARAGGPAKARRRQSA